MRSHAHGLVMVCGGAAAVVVTLARVGHAQQTAPLGVITGIVTDTALKPVESAEVLLLGTDIVLTVDRSGRFEFRDVPPRGYTLTVRRLGYKPMVSSAQVAAGDTLRLSIMLQPAANTLGRVTVTGKSLSPKMQEFEDRRKLGMGEFWDAAEIEKRGAIRVADVLRQSKTIRLIPAPGNFLGAWSARLSGGGWPNGVGKPNCPMQLFVDGFPYNTGDQGKGVVDLNSLMSPKDVSGIEVYAGPATLPVQFNTGPNRTCGAVLIWTKDR